MQRNRFQAGGDDKQEETVFYDESEQKAIIEELHRDHVRFIRAMRTATSMLAALICTLYIIEALAQALESAEVISIMHMELKDLDSASLALLMGMGALGCIGPLMAGMNNEKRAQPNMLPALWLSLVSALGPATVLITTSNAPYFLENKMQLWLPCAAPFVALTSLYSEHTVWQNQCDLETLKKQQYKYHKP